MINTSLKYELNKNNIQYMFTTNSFSVKNNIRPKLLIGTICFITTLFLTQKVLSQNEVYKNKIYRNNIRTAIIHPKGHPLKAAVIEKDKGEILELSFDELNSRSKTFSYTLIHCNADWTPSNMFYSEYIDGYEENEIYNYEFSFNTLVKYVHYKLELPNEELKFKISGNYVIKIYEGRNKEDLVITKRFSILEPNFTIKGKVHKATNPAYMERRQEIDFEVNTNTRLSDAFTEVKTIIVKNNRWETARPIKPLFVNNNRLQYNYEEENTFDGGNEFNHFDAINIRYKEIETKRIVYEEPYYHFILEPDKVRNGLSYIHKDDINGGFVVRLEKSERSEIEADYVVVHFILPYKIPIAKGSIYVIGEFNDWLPSDLNKMTYNFDLKAYTGKILIKQGYYEYQYGIVWEKEKDIDFNHIEGNHSETENDYTIYTYFRPFGGQYDKLMGVKKLNSLKNIY